mmetsp:Transcript_6873/g.16541  ORF Transcript_6873/g.16541 Transcript_6873/m.16541 type:complete len:215 (-) Transcript_6873:9-653(-)
MLAPFLRRLLMPGRRLGCLCAALGARGKPFAAGAPASAPTPPPSAGARVRFSARGRLTVGLSPLDLVLRARPLSHSRLVRMAALVRSAAARLFERGISDQASSKSEAAHEVGSEGRAAAQLRRPAAEVPQSRPVQGGAGGFAARALLSASASCECEEPASSPVEVAAATAPNGPASERTLARLRQAITTPASAAGVSISSARHDVVLSSTQSRS